MSNVCEETEMQEEEKFDLREFLGKSHNFSFGIVDTGSYNVSSASTEISLNMLEFICVYYIMQKKLGEMADTLVRIVVKHPSRGITSHINHLFILSDYRLNKWDIEDGAHHRSINVLSRCLHYILRMEMQTGPSVDRAKLIGLRIEKLFKEHNVFSWENIGEDEYPRTSLEVLDAYDTVIMKLRDSAMRNVVLREFAENLQYDSKYPQLCVPHFL